MKRPTVFNTPIGPRQIPQFLWNRVKDMTKEEMFEAMGSRPVDPVIVETVDQNGWWAELREWREQQST